MKACMHNLSSCGMVHQGERSVAECGPVANRMEGAGGLLVYITEYVGRSAWQPNVMEFSVMYSKAKTTFFAVASAKSLPLMFVCPLILRIIVGSANSARY